MNNNNINNNFIDKFIIYNFNEFIINKRIIDDFLIIDYFYNNKTVSDLSLKYLLKAINMFILLTSTIIKSNIIMKKNRLKNKKYYK